MKRIERVCRVVALSLLLWPTTSAWAFYNPSVGRWLNRDPMGEAAGANLHAFVGNDPVNRVDPVGLYEVDVHRYLTRYLAANAGFCPDEAQEIGVATQALDDPGDERDAMHGGRNLPNMRNYHFVSEARLLELRKKAMLECQCTLGQRNWVAMGEYFHALQDTYSHSAGSGKRTWDYFDGPLSFSPRLPEVRVPRTGIIGGHELRLGYDIGHGAKGHSADWTWLRRGRAYNMALHVFSELQSFARFCGNRCPGKDWQQIWKPVDRFIKFEPPMKRVWTFEGGIPAYVETVTFAGYTQKIQILDRRFALDPNDRRHYP